jgi:hypothetical protein
MTRWTPRRWAWRARLAATALAGAAGLASLGGGCPRPDFAHQADPAGAAERAVPIPTLWEARADQDRGNALEAIFVHVIEPGRAEVTLVFRDEDQPFPAFDLAYDAYRWFAFGRKADVETFGVSYALPEGDGAPGSPDSPGSPGSPDSPDLLGSAGARGRLLHVDLDDVYAGDQPFAVPVAEHRSARLDAAELARGPDGRHVLVVATWNHMLRERDTEPDLDMRPAAVAALYRGSRAEVERMFAVARGGR